MQKWNSKWECDAHSPLKYASTNMKEIQMENEIQMGIEYRCVYRETVVASEWVAKEEHSGEAPFSE